MVEWLEDQGYEPEAQVTQKGEIALRGGILDIYPLTSPWPVRMEFFGDELESLRQFDPLTQISREEVTGVTIPPAGELGLLKKMRNAECGVRSEDPQPSTLNPQPRLVSNLVIMGMGEPLANYENLLKALRILNAPWGGGIGARKITISTSGLAPQIRKLAEEPLQFRLAISLHGATDATRNKIMPVNRKYPLSELTAACEYYQQKRGRMITFEYVLIAGVNDGLDQVRPLAALARRLKAKVNLIPYNRVEGLPWECPTDEAQEAFLKALEKQKIAATLRREKGGDIDAACGQLRLKTERELSGQEAVVAVGGKDEG